MQDRKILMKLLMKHIYINARQEDSDEVTHDLTLISSPLPIRHVYYIGLPLPS